MRNIMFRVFIILLILGKCNAGWERVYGGCQGDIGQSVAVVPSGGYIVAGYTFSFGAGREDFYLIRLNEAGDTIWTRAYGTNLTDWAYSVAPTLDGGFVVAGRCREGSASAGNAYIIKVNANGDTVWTREYGSAVGLDEARYVNTALGGGYIVVGYSDSYSPPPYYFDVYVLRLYENGDTMWTRTYGGEYDDGCFAGANKTRDGGFIITGASNSFSPTFYNQVYLLKLSSSGDLIWQRSYGGGLRSEGWSVIETHDGGFAIAGRLYQPGSYEDVYIIKTDSIGDTIWTRTYGASDWADAAYSILQVDHNRLSVAGVRGYYCTSGENWYDMWLLMVDINTGDTLWTKTYGGLGSDLGFSHAMTPDGGFIIAGYTHHYLDACSVDVYVVKTDSLGNVEWVSELSQKPRSTKILVSPNPFSSYCTIYIPNEAEVEIYSIDGRRVWKKLNNESSSHQLETLPTDHIVWIPDPTVKSGMYFVKVTIGKQTITKNLVLMR